MSRLNKSNINRGISYLKRNGISASYYKALERLQRDSDEADVKKFIDDERLIKAQVEEQKGIKFPQEYKISILIPAYETEPELLRQTIESVANQSYGNWELCIADASKDSSRREVIRQFNEDYNFSISDRFGSIYEKVKYIHLDENKGISGNTNEALNMATGDYISLLDHDDLLDPRALYEFVNAVNNSSNKILFAYTDEDKISEDNSRYFDFHVKPDFDPVLLCTNNYICHLIFVDRLHAKSVGEFYSDYDGAQDHDFICRCVEGLDREQIIHIPKMMYHWRSTVSSTAENPEAKLYAYESGKRAVIDHLKRLGINAKVTNSPHLGFFDIEYEDIVAKVHQISSSRLATLNNDYLESIKEDYILILSDELNDRNGNNVKRMLSCMNFPNVGAVTGKIIAKNGRVKSAGYDKIKGGELAPRFAGLNRHFSGYLHRASIAQCVQGFSNECVLLKKDDVKSFGPQIELKEGRLIYFEPKAVFYACK